MNPMLLASSVMTLHNGVPCQTASWSSRITGQREITSSSFISKSKKTRLLAPQMYKSGSAGSQGAFTSMSLLPQLRLHKYIPEYKTLKTEPFCTAFDWQGHYTPNYSQAHSRQTECFGRDVCVVPVYCAPAKLLESIVKGMQVLAMKAIWNGAEMWLFTAINRTNKAHNQSDNPSTMWRLCGIT